MDRSKMAIVLGNGPSLRGFDFKAEIPSDVTTFGMNVAYRYWHEINWYPTCYCCCDPMLCFSRRDDISELVINKRIYNIKKFFLRMNLCSYLKERNVTEGITNYEFWFIRNNYTKYIPKILATGAVACFWAATLGYKTIVLLGIDANYQCNELVDYKPLLDVDNELPGCQAVSINSAPSHNVNYFFDGYQQHNDVIYWAKTSDAVFNKIHTDSFVYIHKYLIGNNVRVINASQSSAVSIFDKLSWDDIKSSYF